MLMEIPTTNELMDNSVAMWEPATTPQPGDRIEFSYRQHWTMDEDPSQTGGHVVATRGGVHDWQPEQRTIVIEFMGPNLEKRSDDPMEPLVEAIGENAAKIKIQGITVQPMPENRWRVSFQIAPADTATKLAETGPVELRCSIRRGGDFLTETWVHRVIP
jgi:glucans biosynthesis protein